MDVDRLTADQLASLCKRLRTDEFTHVLFVSPSGNGLKWIVKIDSIDPTEHKAFFRQLADYLHDVYGLTRKQDVPKGEHSQIDSSGSDVCRACFLPHDPDVYYNPDSTVMPLLEKYQQVSKPTKSSERRPDQSGLTDKYSSPDDDTIQRVTDWISELHRLNIDLTADHSDWIRIGFALASLGEVARPYYHEVSRLYPNYDYQETDDKFSELLRNGTGQVTIGTFFYACEQAIGATPKAAYNGHNGQPPQNDRPVVENTLSIQALQDAVSAEANALKQTAYVMKSHQQILNDLLKQIQPIDFREKAGFDPDDEDAKLKREHYLVIVVEEFLALAKRNQWDLCKHDGSFFLYNGAFWKPINKDDLKTLLRKAAERMGVEKFKAKHFEFSDQLFKQFTELAHLPAPDSDYHTVKINLINGTFEIGTDRQYLRPPDAADFLTHQLPFAYNPEATAPQFKLFLDRVLPDEACQKVVAEYLGYIFISAAKLKLEKCLLLFGSGANGKSVFFEIVMAILGTENVSNYSLQSLTSEPAYCRAHLATKLVNYASEINGKLEADIFKQMVSGEPVEARLPYGQPFIMTNYAKFIFNCNELPTDVEHTPAYFRRFLIVPFGVTIPENEQDKQLASKIIMSELSGVFNWILAGLRRLLAQGKFTDCEAVREQLESYKKQSDSVRLFLDEQGYQTSTDHTPLKELYQGYKVFCVEDGYRPVNNKNFQKRLNTIGIMTERARFGFVAYVNRSAITY